MAYDEGLAERIREVLQDEAGIKEKKMFGGLGFILFGNMAVGVIGDDLMVRAPAEDYDSLLAKPGVRPFDMTGKPMRGWVMVAADSLASDDDLAEWVRLGADYAATVPPK